MKHSSKNSGDVQVGRKGVIGHRRGGSVRETPRTSAERKTMRGGDVKPRARHSPPCVPRGPACSTAFAAVCGRAPSLPRRHASRAPLVTSAQHTARQGAGVDW